MEPTKVKTKRTWHRRSAERYLDCHKARQQEVSDVLLARFGVAEVPAVYKKRRRVVKKQWARTTKHINAPPNCWYDFATGGRSQQVPYPDWYKL